MSILSEIAEEEFTMEMTPMIDVTFLLLIFFILTLKFKTLEGKLQAYLPKDVGVNQSDAEPLEKVEIKITLIAPGEKRDPKDLSKPWKGELRFEYVGRKVRYHIGPQKTEDLAVLRTRLKRLFDAAKASGEKRPATIDARAGITYGDVVPVLDRAIEVGYEDITFIGEYK